MRGSRTRIVGLSEKEQGRVAEVHNDLCNTLLPLCLLQKLLLSS